MAWRRGQPYSQDLRDRIFAAVDDGSDVAEVAELFKVDRSYIYKALLRRRLTGETRARPQRCRLEPKLAPYHASRREWRRFLMRRSRNCGLGCLRPTGSRRVLVECGRRSIGSG
jgi:Transposase